VVGAAAQVALMVCAPAGEVRAGSVRLWPSAVVVEETIRLSDLCDLTGFDESVERRLAGLAVADAPPAGGARVIHMAMIRAALTASGANMATVTLGGPTQCAVTRPSAAVKPSVSPSRVGAQRTAARAKGSQAEPPTPSTLRDAVFDYFDTELVRFKGKAEIDFDRTAQRVLDLSGPEYRFRVRRRGGPALGLVQLEVDVLAKGKVVQTVPLVVRVVMMRRVVVARNPVNQGATVKASDVELTALSFSRVENLGVADTALVVGQRAKRFISAGCLIEPAMLESVPLVTRGQLVKLTSVVGMVRVVTSAKALDSGLLGETIRVRAPDNKRSELDGVVVGPGRVQIGSAPAEAAGSVVAMGSSP
jgi:flagella basal body P-ring formation protein FlgA